MAWLQFIGNLAVTNLAYQDGIAVPREICFGDGQAGSAVFDNEGRLLMFFGDPAATGPGATCLPAGVVVDYENAQRFQKFAAPGYKVEYLILMTNQYGAPKVGVYGFLKKQ